MKKICVIEACTKKFDSHGYCKLHADRYRKHGDPLYVLTPEKRFWGNVMVTPSCWYWLGAKNASRYGVAGIRNKKWLAHRYSYNVLVEPVVKGSHIDHKCHNPSCVNPQHLRQVTAKENLENVPKPRKDNTSGYRGVTWNKRGRKWVVKVTHNGKHYWGGTYSDIEEANLAAIKLRTSLFSCNDYER